MKVNDIVKRYSLDPHEFETFVARSSFPHKESLMGALTIDDSADVNQLLAAYQQWQAEKQAKRDRAAQARAEKNAALARMLITSGFNFDGYTITKYSGYISGDDAIQVPRENGILFTSGVNVADALMESLVIIRRNALQELKEAAYALGCNAVIGVDFDYITLDPQRGNITGTATFYEPYVFGVTANGNAVIIEKNE